MVNKYAIYALKLSRNIYARVFEHTPQKMPVSEQNPDRAAQLIYDALMDGEPRMIARFGAFELDTVLNYLGVKNSVKNKVSYIRGKSFQWWWEKSLISSLQNNAGFFPGDIDQIEQFCELMISDISEVDILGSWLKGESLFAEDLQDAERIRLTLLDPYWSATPWTTALKGKKVLVVHPFAETIASQYKKRKLLFKNDLLPEFELMTIKAVQSIAGSKTNFKNWFEALEAMKLQIDQHDYEVCLLGCGAYGFPLAAHVKRSGKKGFHLGGSLQLLFGIKGGRWNKDYSRDYDYSTLMNEHWSSPAETERPDGASQVEGACYW